MNEKQPIAKYDAFFLLSDKKFYSGKVIQYRDEMQLRITFNNGHAYEKGSQIEILDILVNPASIGENRD